MLIVILFFLGLTSFALLLGWCFSAFLFIFGDSPYPGAIAYLPRWVFIPSIFILLYGSKPVQKFIFKLMDLMIKKKRKEEVMKIEILMRDKGFAVLFLDVDPGTVAMVKGFSIALLSGMGYSLEVTNIEKKDNFLFFNVRSTNNRELRVNDLFYAINEATKIKEEVSYF